MKKNEKKKRYNLFNRSSLKFYDLFFFSFLFTCFCSQELKGRFVVKGKRLNKLDAAFNNNSAEEDDSVSEEDEAADCKENGQKPKDKVR